MARSRESRWVWILGGGEAAGPWRIREVDLMAVICPVLTGNWQTQQKATVIGSKDAQAALTTHKPLQQAGELAKCEEIKMNVK